MKRVLSLESDKSLSDSRHESSTTSNDWWSAAVPDISNSKNVEGSW